MIEAVLQSRISLALHSNVALREEGNVPAKEVNRRRPSLGVKISPCTSSAVWFCCVNKAFLQLLKARDRQ